MCRRRNLVKRIIGRFEDWRRIANPLLQDRLQLPSFHSHRHCHLQPKPQCQRSLIIRVCLIIFDRNLVMKRLSILHGHFNTCAV